MTLDEAQAQATSTAVTASLEGKRLATIWRIDRFIFDERGGLVMECQTLRHAELQAGIFITHIHHNEVELAKREMELQKAQMSAELDRMKFEAMRAKSAPMVRIDKLSGDDFLKQLRR